MQPKINKFIGLKKKELECRRKQFWILQGLRVKILKKKKKKRKKLVGERDPRLRGKQSSAHFGQVAGQTVTMGKNTVPFGKQTYDLDLICVMF